MYDVLACPTAIYPELLDAILGRAAQLGKQHTDESLPATGAGAHPDGDLLVALELAFLELDQSSKGARDGRREVAAGELLRAIEERQVAVGNVDGLVRHGIIITSATSIRIWIRIGQWITVVGQPSVFSARGVGSDVAHPPPTLRPASGRHDRSGRSARSVVPGIHVSGRGSLGAAQRLRRSLNSAGRWCGHLNLN